MLIVRIMFNRGLVYFMMVVSCQEHRFNEEVLRDLFLQCAGHGAHLVDCEINYGNLPPSIVNRKFMTVMLWMKEAV